MRISLIMDKCINNKPVFLSNFRDCRKSFDEFCTRVLLIWIFFVPEFRFFYVLCDRLITLMKPFLATFFVLAGLFVCHDALTRTVSSSDLRKIKQIDKALDFAYRQSMLLYDSVKDMDELPDSYKDGKLVTCPPKTWVSGFFPGVLWYLYENTGDKAVLEAADDVTLRLTEEQYNTNSHDIGFVLNCSFGNGYRLTGNEQYRSALINGGRSLASRYNPVVGCTRSWRPRFGWDFVVIIDNMMNLELLTVSSALSGDLECMKVARSHADVTLKNHFRPDGSSYHVVDYDEKTGAVRGRITRQGLSDDSAWARGQGWGLYGFTMMYRQTGDERYLEQAIRIGEFIMNHPNLPKDKIPYWDFDVRAEKDTPRDASAGALMASAFLELSTYISDQALSERFFRLAEEMLASLSSKKYRAEFGKDGCFILKHSTVFFANGNFDTPIAYADYYYVEALTRYKRILSGQSPVYNTGPSSEKPDRALWLGALDHIARPVLTNLSKGTLKENMPVESTATNIESRRSVTHLEALGRLIEGIAPWMELGPDVTPEGKLRAEYIRLTKQAIANAVNPDSPDCLNFDKGRQPLVDAAFLAHGLLRAPVQIWGNLDPVTRDNLIAALKSTRVIKPLESNWLLFPAIIEAALLEFTGEWEFERVQYALTRHREWYKGDGLYGDGPSFHMDYYNSYVIQPMLIQVLDVMKRHGVDSDGFYELEAERYGRFAEIQERLISPEGTYPVMGRSIAYRFGAFQALSDASLRHLLPERVAPAQVRSALSAVIRRQLGAPGTFDSNGWLRPGFCGHQPGMGEGYISTGSLYLCSAVFVALGLPEGDSFWSSPSADWTSKRAWDGQDVDADHAIKN